MIAPFAVCKREGIQSIPGESRGRSPGGGKAKRHKIAGVSLRWSVFGTILLLVATAHGARLEKGRLVQLDERILFKNPAGIVVTGSEAIICDKGTCRLYVISLQNGRVIKEFGRKGEGPNEFSFPSIRDYGCGLVVITDWGKNLTDYYRYDPKNHQFSFSHRIGTKMSAVFETRILNGAESLFTTSGTVDPRDKQTYLMMIADQSGQKRYLLKRNDSFGEKVDFERDWSRAQLILALPIYNMCCFNEKWFMYHWVGNLQPVVMDRSGGERVPLRLKASGEYKKPKDYYLFERARKRAMEMGSMKDYWHELEKYSWVTFDFLSKRTIGIVYANYSTPKQGWRTRLALYSMGGDLLLERELAEIVLEGVSLGWPGDFFYDQGKKTLYALSHQIGTDGEDAYAIVSYRIDE